jgi:hypothetical protein
MMTGIEGLAGRFQPDPLAGTDNQYAQSNLPTQTCDSRAGSERHKIELRDVSNPIPSAKAT